MISRLMPPGYGKQLEILVHVLMTGGSADADAFVFQKYSHQTVTRNAFAFMIGLSYYGQEPRLISVILCFSVLEIIAVYREKYSEGVFSFQ